MDGSAGLIPKEKEWSPPRSLIKGGSGEGGSTAVAEGEKKLS